jgi:hypothetical protein
MSNNTNTLLNFHAASPEKKKTTAFGLQIAKHIEKHWNSEYYSSRNKRIEKNVKFAVGKQPMQEYLSQMSMDGKDVYINLDTTPPPIAPKFVEVVIGSLMKREEKPRVSAVDPISLRQKFEDKSKAKFKMENKDFIAQVEGELNTKLTDDSEYTPEDSEDLNLYFELEHRLPEEIFFEEGLQYVWDSNSTSVIKRRVIFDTITAGFAGIKTTMDESGKIKLKKCIPQNMIYSFSEYDDFRDASFIGEVQPMKITEIRVLYPQLDEEKIFEISQKAKNRQTVSRWDERYRTLETRPYDEFSVDVLMFELKTIDNLLYQVKKTSNGSVVIDKKDKNPDRLGDNKEMINKNIFVIYEGAYVLNSGIMLQWKKQSNMIKPSMPEKMAEAYFSYSIHMPDNYELSNLPMIQRMETSIRQMTLTHMKIQQMVAKMRPAGMMIDVNGLQNISLGEGKTIEPLEIQKIYDQTGNMYYRSVDEEGQRQGPPMQEISNSGSVAQLQELINIFNYYLNRLREETGINELRDGAGINPRLGNKQLQAGIAASNNATDFIYETYVNIIENTMMKCGILLTDAVKYRVSEYSAIVKTDINNRYFDIKVEMMPDDEYKQYLDAMVQTSLSSGAIDFEVAFNIRNIKNVKLGEMYLSRATKKKQQEQQAQAQQNAQMNAQSQQQSLQMKAQADAQLEQMQGEYKINSVRIEQSMRGENDMQTFVMNILQKSFELDRPLTPELQAIVDMYFQKEQEKKAAEQQAAMEQQQQAEQEQQAQQTQEG